MRKKTKKISKPVKDQLRFLVEEFLEKSVEEIMAKIGGRSDAGKTMWEKLEGSLSDDIFWMDEVDPEDKAKSDYEKLLKDNHAFLKPIWNQFRNALFNYKYNIILERAKLHNVRETIDRDKESPIFEYKELIRHETTALDLEKYYDIALKESFEPGTLTVSFELGYVTFYRNNLNVVKNFIDLLSGVNIEHFARCSHCGKCIILIRSDKRFCHGCAAKKYQKDKWARDPEGMKEKERLRYRELRKKH